MERVETESLGDKIFLQQNVPLKWESVAENEVEGLISKVSYENKSTLSKILSIDESTFASVVDAGDTETDLARIEFKLNTLMDLVSCLIAQQLHLPKPRELRLSSGNIQWQMELDTEVEVTPKGYYLLSVWFKEEYPRPVKLVCFCTECLKADEILTLKCNYHCGSDTETALLEKLIFRHHRRTIAHRTE